MSPCPPGRRKNCRSKPRATPSPTSSAGSGKFCNASGPAGRADRRRRLGRHHAARRGRQPLAGAFDSGDEVEVQAGEDGIRFLLVSGKPLEEPVAWYGPIVMNTQEQLRQAFEELEKGTFLKAG